jgi:hypothetical protein
MMRTNIDSLNQFIKDHPEIIINKSEISIPQELREEFYRRFDDVRRAFVEEQYASLPVDVQTLSDNYIRVENEIIETLSIERIAVPVDLHSFLHNPGDGLIRVMYNRLFDLLQGKTTFEEFQTASANDIRTAAGDLYRLGYEMWAALAFIKLLDPDKGYFVDLDDDYKPYLTDLKEIAFGRQAHHPTLRIPEFVLHSRKVDKYVTVKMGPAREIDTFVVRFTPPVRPKKKTGDTSYGLDSRVMLLTFLPTPDEIPIVAEIYDRKLVSPDMMIEFLTADEFESQTALDDVRRHFNAMNPRLGMCLLVIDPRGEAKPEPVAEKIRAISAGFDPAKMEPILEQV